jgi:preprotein translocase subunit SecB
VELKDLRLLEVNASGAPRSKGVLQPLVIHECEGKLQNPNLIEVVCRYRFKATQGETQAMTATFSYLILYDLEGAEPVPESDLKEFAFANGTYHSWPFARQLLFDLTSRLGYLPYSLPVFKFMQRPRPANPAEEVKATEPSKPVAPEAQAVASKTTKRAPKTKIRP